MVGTKRDRQAYNSSHSTRDGDGAENNNIHNNNDNNFDNQGMVRLTVWRT